MMVFSAQLAEGGGCTASLPTPFHSISSHTWVMLPPPPPLSKTNEIQLPKLTHIFPLPSSLWSVLWWNLQRARSTASSVRGSSAASFLSTQKLLAFLLKHMSLLKSQESSRAGALVYPCRVSGGNSALLNTIREITEEDRCVSAVFLFPLSRQGETSEFSS